ncbi:Transglutaminase-like superfamily protein [Nocardia amikacinitolerans]|uniref:lasso peptide biosynthesis B2 protein n=1 Tax=Nocardia amikacinitolerans TaxID=756689 RepID=UPI0020A2B672|nr:lasso peptide biosynthesis B2 protein [Nocardia amikacinitolerans]MCP2294457.1 Transglutaminase-like superfamily protein [Nocardia amikacinitolerans]
MSDPMALENAPAVHGWERLLARLAVAGAWPLTKLSPRRLRRVLTLVHRGAAPATYGQALAARESVVAVSVRCAGQGCLHRALATALLCRMRGVWPVWCSGVRTEPFRAHAWVEAERLPVGEPFPTGYYTATLTVPPCR